MIYPLSTLERAFELARSGEYAGVQEIRQQLKKERFESVEAHLAGPSINRQLKALCEESRREPPTPLDAAVGLAGPTPLGS
jgi:hypothetical protein